MILWTVGSCLVAYALGKAAYLHAVKPWEYCSNCEWITKNSDGTCCGCGMVRNG